MRFGNPRLFRNNDAVIARTVRSELE